MAKKKEPDKLDKLIGELTKDATAEELLKDSGLLRELKNRLSATAQSTSSPLDSPTKSTGSPGWT